MLNVSPPGKHLLFLAWLPSAALLWSNDRLVGPTRCAIFGGRSPGGTFVLCFRPHNCFQAPQLASMVAGAAQNPLRWDMMISCFEQHAAEWLKALYQSLLCPSCRLTADIVFQLPLLNTLARIGRYTVQVERGNVLRAGTNTGQQFRSISNDLVKLPNATQWRWTSWPPGRLVHISSCISIARNLTYIVCSYRFWSFESQGRKCPRYTTPPTTSSWTPAFRALERLLLSLHP